MEYPYLKLGSMPVEGQIYPKDKALWFRIRDIIGVDPKKFLIQVGNIGYTYGSPYVEVIEYEPPFEYIYKVTLPNLKYNQEMTVKLLAGNTQGIAILLKEKSSLEG